MGTEANQLLAGRVMIACEYCEKAFASKLVWIRSKRQRQKYCSRGCANQGRRKGIRLTCAACGAPFERQPSKVAGWAKHYCSRTCYLPNSTTAITRVARTYTRIPAPIAVTTCSKCGKSFDHPARNKRKVCSLHCRRRLYRARCERCGTEFEHRKARDRKYCSRSCRSLAVASQTGHRGTDIEILLHKAFTDAGLAFETGAVLLNRYLPDFLFRTQKLIVEADGEWWHKRARDAQRDSQRDALLLNDGFRVIRFTGSYIRADPQLCAALVKSLLPKGSVQDLVAGEIAL